MIVAGVGYSHRFVCVSVCFSARYQKTDAARIAKLDTEMFHDGSWKPIYSGVKGQNTAGVVF